MKKYFLVFAALALVFSVLGCDQNTPVATDQNDASAVLSKAAYEREWTAHATAWRPIDIVPSCDNPCSFAKLCAGDPDVMVEIPETLCVTGRRIQSPISGDFHNPNVDGVRMMLDGKIDHFGNGFGRGLIEINAAMGDHQGKFQGTFEAKFTDEMCSGTFVARGKSGDFANMWIRGTIGEGDAFTLKGTMTYAYPGD